MNKVKHQTREQRKAAKLAARTAKYGPKAKTSFRRNGLPILIGVAVMLTFMAALNGQWLAAQAKYHFTKPVFVAGAPAKVSPSTVITAADTKSPHPELGPQLTIPAIKVNAPIQLNQGSAEWQIQVGLRKGVVHYDNSANPGEVGNVAIFGHSSGQVWAPGDYKFIFTLLNKVQVDDAIYIDYNGTRYTYKVVNSEVVKPTDVAVLKQSADHELTLITCTPVGTSTNRLVVHAVQVSPDPEAKPAAQTAAKPAPQSAGAPTELPSGAHGSIWQSIRNLF